MERAATSMTTGRPSAPTRSSACTGPSRKPRAAAAAITVGGQRGLDRHRLARRGDVDRLLEERAVERVGLVEDGQHLEGPGHQEGLDGDFGAGDEALDQHRFQRPGNGMDAVDGRPGLDVVIDPDDPWLPERDTGLTTHGYPIRDAAAATL